MNTASQLTAHVIQRIQQFETLTPIHTDNNSNVYAILMHPQSGIEVGSIRVYQGSNIIDKVVEVNLRADEMAMDAYMVMAFTRPGSLYPHLAFDTELQTEDSAFHIDLLHKREFSTDIAYIQSVMQPLSNAFNAANNNPDFRFSEATLLMKALLNPWMASYHCAPEYLPDAQVTIDAYLDHWLSLAKRPADEFQVNTDDCDTVAAFDRAHRAAIFDPQVDILWEMISNLIGTESRDLILRLVRGTNEKAPLATHARGNTT
ncbi:hypothetical protein [Oceanicoccus sp. KOV_DT_Chl]|uniref:hypothetical protein n=1 Tax=Oceanicoccus sp. KOV_DT_Chl TaxID=1904639 RepID=UPI000C7A2341|nr:hypothetical protein [Oceanicoccus sp. KOV_DT_Chl]